GRRGRRARRRLHRAAALGGRGPGPRAALLRARGLGGGQRAVRRLDPRTDDGRVPPRGVSLFCDTALAARIERAEARLIARASDAARRRRGDAVGFVLPIAGGVARFAEADSPFNKVAGGGFYGVPPEGERDAGA